MSGLGLIVADPSKETAITLAQLELWVSQVRDATRAIRTEIAVLSQEGEGPGATPESH